MADVTMEKLVNLCKARGFVYPGSDIYGGLANSWDYGPLGVELKKNIIDAWWKRFVTSRRDMVGIDAAVIMNPKVWEASGHLAEFTDPLVECKACHSRYRVDQIVQDDIHNANLELLRTVFKDEEKEWGSKQEMVDHLIDAIKVISPNRPDLASELIDEAQTILDSTKGNHESLVFLAREIEKKSSYLGLIAQLDLKQTQCPNCKRIDWTDPASFNLMFKTFLGSTEDAAGVAYLRGELAQGMFVDFPMVQQSSRKRVPFGIAQVGKCFRNEITPGNFIFRTREFNLMEFEYFIHPSEWEKHFEYWLGEMKAWLKFLGVADDKLVYHDIEDGERAHYSKRTVDIEYHYPFGQKELYGLAYRTDFDLKNHMEKSGKDLRYTDPMTNEKYLPHVIEPTFGIDRSLLVTLLEAYREEEAPTSEEGESATRVVLKLPKSLAPYKVAVLPLSKKDELSSVALKLADDLRTQFACDYDETQSIGKRYRRQDEIGTPFCVTVDFDSLTDQSVTVRDRDTMAQERVKIAELADYLKNKLA